MILGFSYDAGTIIQGRFYHHAQLTAIVKEFINIKTLIPKISVIFFNLLSTLYELQVTSSQTLPKRSMNCEMLSQVASL